MKLRYPLLVGLGLLSAAARAESAGGMAAPEVYDAVESDAVAAPVTKPEEPRLSRFGFSLGMGAQTVTGNRGLLWQQASPRYELKAMVWATPQLALGISGSWVNELYETSPSNGGRVDVSLKHVGLDARYYLDLASRAPSIGFMSPFASVGVAAYSKTESSFEQGVSDSDTAFGMGVAAGLRFTAVPRTLHFELEGRWDSVTFKDTYSSTFVTSNSLMDLTGQFFTWTASVLITL